jgi:ATP-dependent Lon protease
VRALEREISKICRKVVKTLLLKKRASKVMVNARNLDKYLGVRRYTFGMAEKENQVGQVTGLAWTEVGGELLTIEAVALPGKGKTITTGKLGEVMQESIQAALSVVRKRSKSLGIVDDFYQKNDIHIHLPEGAIPKDGPISRYRHLHGAGVSADRYSGALRCGHDWRDHAARRSAPYWRPQGESCWPQCAAA